MKRTLKTQKQKQEPFEAIIPGFAGPVYYGRQADGAPWFQIVKSLGVVDIEVVRDFITAPAVGREAARQAELNATGVKVGQMGRAMTLGHLGV